jgi:ribonucleotide monophosphatase NagD (HAD superfamily)
MSAKEKILKFLSKESGYNTLTAAQARARFGIVNVGARIEELRAEGYCIYTNKKTLADGRRITYYKLGKPTKKMIAAAHAVLGGQAFA